MQGITYGTKQIQKQSYLNFNIVYTFLSITHILYFIWLSPKSYIVISTVHKKNTFRNLPEVTQIALASTRLLKPRISNPKPKFLLLNCFFWRILSPLCPVEDYFIKDITWIQRKGLQMLSAKLNGKEDRP